jgi:hypothetical protein
MFDIGERHPRRSRSPLVEGSRAEKRAESIAMAAVHPGFVEYLRVLDDVKLRWVPAVAPGTPYLGREVIVGHDGETTVRFYAHAHPPVLPPDPDGGKFSSPDALVEWLVQRRRATSDGIGVEWRIPGDGTGAQVLPSSVATRIGRMQRRVLGRRRGPISLRRPAVVAFVDRRTSPGQRPHFPSLVKAWDLENADQSYGGRSKNMARDYREESRRASCV